MLKNEAFAAPCQLKMTQSLFLCAAQREKQRQRLLALFPVLMVHDVIRLKRPTEADRPKKTNLKNHDQTTINLLEIVAKG